MENQSQYKCTTEQIPIAKIHFQSQDLKSEYAIIMGRQKSRFHIENPGQIRIWGLRGSGGHFYWKTRKPFIFMVLGPSARDHDSQDQLFLLLGTPNYIKYFKKKPNHS